MIFIMNSGLFSHHFPLNLVVKGGLGIGTESESEIKNLIIMGVKGSFGLLLCFGKWRKIDLHVKHTLRIQK